MIQNSSDYLNQLFEENEFSTNYFLDCMAQFTENL